MPAAITKKPITRKRDALTCLQCRAKKLRCNKEVPCSSCVKRDDGPACTYANKPVRKETVDESRAYKAEARLSNLERLVHHVVTTNTSNIAPATDDADDKFADNARETATYTGATHYSAMLEDIEELRQVLADDDDHLLSPDPSSGDTARETDVLFGGARRMSKSAILATHLPPKVEVDRRLAAYFRAEAIAAPFIHVPQFMRQYEQFWTRQMATNPLWISMLFSICSLSRSTGRGAGPTRANETSSDSSTTRNFSLAAAHCLSLGQYNRPQRFAVEALGLYIQAKVIATLDPSRDIGILFATLIQLAYCQGYHRDPVHFKHLTPFERELRRRAWSYCLQLDLLNSFQLGLPNNVLAGSWDTKIPANLRDSDFDEDSAVLPSPRPYSDHTKVSFYNAKHMLMTVFEKILRHALSATGPRPEDELVALENDLNAAYYAIPNLFHYKKVEKSLCDPVWLVTTRKCVELMYQKCRCVLHRKHITRGRLESTWVCYEASMALVTAFQELYPEFKPGGQFYEDRWLLGSISWNDFLLGVMVLTLVLCQHRKSSVAVLRDDQVESLVATLKISKEICSERLTESTGAQRTNRLLEELFSKLEQGSTSLPVHKPLTYPTQDGTLQNGAAMQPEFALSTAPWDWNNEWAFLDNNVFEVDEWSFLEDCLTALPSSSYMEEYGPVK